MIGRALVSNISAIPHVIEEEVYIVTVFSWTFSIWEEIKKVQREMGEKELQMPVKKLFLWVRRQSKNVKIFLGVVTSLALVVILKFFIKKHNHFFVLAEFVHFVGLLCLIYKLSTLKTCSGTYSWF